MFSAIWSFFAGKSSPESLSPELQALTKLLVNSKLDGCQPWSYQRRFIIYFAQNKGKIEFDYNTIRGRFDGCMTFWLDGKIVDMPRSWELFSGYGSYLKVITQAYPQIPTLCREFQEKYELKEKQEAAAKAQSLAKIIKS